MACPGPTGSCGSSRSPCPVPACFGVALKRSPPKLRGTMRHKNPVCWSPPPYCCGGSQQTGQPPQINLRRQPSGFPGRLPAVGLSPFAAPPRSGGQPPGNCRCGGRPTAGQPPLRLRLHSGCPIGWLCRSPLASGSLIARPRLAPPVPIPQWGPLPGPPSPQLPGSKICPGQTGFASLAPARWLSGRLLARLLKQPSCRRSDAPRVRFWGFGGFAPAACGLLPPKYHHPAKTVKGVVFLPKGKNLHPHP